MQTPQETTTTPEERATEFVPVKGGEDTTSAATLLVIAYVLMWALVFGFLALTWRKNRALHERLSALESSVKKTEQ